MKRGLNEVEFVALDDKIIGVNLGWDWAAEHEWGIKELRQGFGLNSRELG